MWKISILISYVLFAVISGGSSMPTSQNKNTRAFGGKDIEISEAPYMVSVHFPLEYSVISFYSGSIISKNVVLVGAVGSCSNWYIRAGSKYHATGGQLIKVKEAKRHPDYNEHTNDYSFSLLYLEKSLELNDNVKPIALPPQDFELPVGAKTKVSGWGQSAFVIPFDTLKQSETHVRDRNSCVIYSGCKLTPRMFCTKGIKQGAAFFEDVFTGLVYDNKLVGVVLSQLTIGLPIIKESWDVYCKVSSVRKWIDENIL